jgi:hypothetical protein
MVFIIIPSIKIINQTLLTQPTGLGQDGGISTKALMFRHLIMHPVMRSEMAWLKKPAILWDTDAMSESARPIVMVKVFPSFMDIYRRSMWA